MPARGGSAAGSNCVAPPPADESGRNIRERLDQDEHATLTILRYVHDGRLRFAGAHEDILVYRAATQRVEFVPTPGAW